MHGGRRESPDHVLVARPGVSATDAAVPRTPNALGVALEADAERWLGDWRNEADRVVVVSAGERSRSAAASTGGSDIVAGSTGSVETVPDRGDVGAVGELVNEYLVAWRGDGETTVYVDDLTALLDASSTETAFRFVHAMLTRASSVGARVVVSVDPDAHAGHVVATFEALFDDVRS